MRTWKYYPDLQMVESEFPIDLSGSFEHICDLRCDIKGNIDDSIGHLIAAAPELLAACEGALFALGDCVVGEHKLRDLFPKKVEELQRVIAKAKNQ